VGVIPVALNKFRKNQLLGTASNSVHLCMHKIWSLPRWHVMCIVSVLYICSEVRLFSDNGALHANSRRVIFLRFRVP
jgi:hypothetical protein